MLGALELLPQGLYPVRSGREVLCGVTLLTEYSPPGRRRLERAARRLRAAGLRRAACPEEGRCREALQRAGVLPVTERAALPYLAAPLTLRALAQHALVPERVTVRLCAAGRNDRLTRAAEELGVRTIWALALPGKVAPRSAAGYIKNTIYHIMDELGA